MKASRKWTAVVVAAFVVSAFWFLVPTVVNAHCDTMDGPVVKDARAALDRGDLAPVLKWIKKDNEPEVRAAFEKTLAVRKQSPQAQELADTYFFETVIRIHRAGEGAPYTGLKPSGTPLEPSVAGADRALESGNINDLATLMTDAVASGIRARYAEALEKKKHADESVEAGREYVEAYVTFVHYVERLHLDATSQAAHGQPEAAGSEPVHHEE